MGVWDILVRLSEEVLLNQACCSFSPARQRSQPALKRSLCKLSRPHPPKQMMHEAGLSVCRNAATRCRRFWVFLIQVAAGFLIQVNSDLGSGCRVSAAVLNNAAAYRLRLGQIKISLTGRVFLTGCWLLYVLPRDLGHQSCPDLLGRQSA